MNHKHTNRLIHATSPYLLQHAHNPVDWYEWSDEALQTAQAENKPILVSIGYSSCHWCHVMERESFEQEDVAELMNANYVCIKVDREERPDIDQIYMEAVQALGVNGGWPLNVFLTPEQKPFFGGTYFSPQAWTQVLTNIHIAFESNAEQIERTGEELRLHLLNSDVKRFVQPAADSAVLDDTVSIYKTLSQRFDKTWGGMDRAPKFVMPSVWRYLLRHYHLTKDIHCLDHVRLTLNKISQGGIYDQLRGGFARYSVDGEWFAPHFEKMLYDNAQLLSLYAEAYAVTKDEGYKSVVYETFDWLQSEMTHPDGGFYSALDADSEGVEGKFYVWSQKEFEKTLGPDAKLISKYYQIKSNGNWEDGHNILFRADDDEKFLKEHKLSVDQWRELLRKSKDKLLGIRALRIRPGLDDKILTAWNGMTITGLMDAYRYLGDQRFLDASIKNIQFILKELADGEILYRSFKSKRTSIMGFLDDYAFTIQGLIKIYEGTFDEQWIRLAAKFTTYAIDHFYDEEEKFFYYTSNAAEKLITRKKEIFDNVIPSSNAVMAQNLFTLGTILDRDAWKEMAGHMSDSLSQLIKGEPNYMSQWAIALIEIKKGLKEVLIVGDGYQEVGATLQKEFRPYAIAMGTRSSSDLPLFEGKTGTVGTDTIYVCERKVCKLPVHTLEDAQSQLD